MSETFYGQISIPLGLIDDEVQEQLEKDFNQAQTFKSSYNMDSITTYYNAYAPDGRFEELENLLREKQIPFDRISDTFFEYRTYYRPESDGNSHSQDIKIAFDKDHRSYIDADVLKPLLVLDSTQAITELRKLIQASDSEIRPLEAYEKGIESSETSREERV